MAYIQDASLALLISKILLDEFFGFIFKFHFFTVYLVIILISGCTSDSFYFPNFFLPNLCLLRVHEFYKTDMAVSDIFKIHFFKVYLLIILIQGCVAVALSISRVLLDGFSCVWYHYNPNSKCPFIRGCGSGSFDFQSFTGRIFMCLISLQSKFKVSFYQGVRLLLLQFLEFYWKDFRVSGIFTIQIQSVSCFLLLWGALTLALSFSRILLL